MDLARDAVSHVTQYDLRVGAQISIGEVGIERHVVGHDDVARPHKVERAAEIPGDVGKLMAGIDPGQIEWTADRVE